VPLPLLAHLWLAVAGLAPPELGDGEVASFEVPPEQSVLGNGDGTVDDAMPSELGPDEVDAVELPWAYVQALRDAAADDAAAAPLPGPWVAEREIDLRPVEDGLLLEGRWTIVAEEAGWLAGELLGPGLELRSATLDGKPAPVVALPGSTLLVAWIEGKRPPARPARRLARAPALQTVELRVRAFLPTTLDDRIELGLLPATRGRLRVAVPGRVPLPVLDEGGTAFGATGNEDVAFGTGNEFDGPIIMGAPGEAAPTRLAGNVIWSGASHMSLRLHDPAGAAPPARDTLAVAHVGVGLTVGDAEVRGRAHVQWELRQGELSRVRASVAGVGDDLTVEGPSVSTWSRSGDALEVELNAPVSGRVDLELKWTQAIAAGDETRLPLPRIEPEAWRSESSLQLARDGELEVIPEVEQGTAIPAASLPAWGQGLVEGTPTAAYEHGAGASAGYLDLLRFVPVPGPPTVVDVADYTVATTDEGRVLMKVRYDVRNDRAAHLAVRPPPGLRIIGARVGQETALPAKDDDETWRIPLRRSLETVDGLLSFPVEVILLGEQEPWQRREQRELPLPTLDAPIAASRVTLYLPPRYRSRLESGERNVVDEFDEGEGLTYGAGVTSDQAAVADALLEEAVQGYLSNDFEGAQQKLEEIEALGVSNANISRLQSNIDVIEGKAEADKKGDVTMERRVKEQAKARASEDFRRQETLIAEAEKSAQAGDYGEAERQYQAALDLGGKLAKLEQKESVEQAVLNTSVEAQLGSVSKKKGKRSKKLQLDTKFKNERSSSLNGGGGGGGSSPATTLDGDSHSDPTSEPPDEAEGQVLASRRVISSDEPLGDPEDPLAGNTTPGPAAMLDVPPEVVVDTTLPAGAAGVLDPTATGADEDGRDSPPIVAENQPSEPMPDPAKPEPTSEFYTDELVSYPGVASEPIVERRSMAGRAGRRALRPQRRGVKYKSAGPARSRLANRRGTATSSGEATGTAVYDFDDDGLDGAVLTPTDDAPMLATLEPAQTAQPDQAPPRNAPLAPPEVTASALSVIVPVTGQTVLYQQLLIEANQTQVIEIHARRRLRR